MHDTVVSHELLGKNCWGTGRVIHSLLRDMALPSQALKPVTEKETRIRLTSFTVLVYRPYYHFKLAGRAGAGGAASAWFRSKGISVAGHRSTHTSHHPLLVIAYCASSTEGRDR